MVDRDFGDKAEEEFVFDDNFYESIQEQAQKSASNINDFSQYARPSLLPNYKSESNDLTFMQIECDYYVGRKQGQDEETGIIRMYGVTKEGNSVLAHIHDFISYFYIEKPLELSDDPRTLNDLRIFLMVDFFIFHLYNYCFRKEENPSGP